MDLKEALLNIEKEFEGNEKSREFEEAITDISDCIEDKDNAFLKEIIDGQDKFLAFIAFFTLFTRYRRSNRLKEMKDLFDSKGIKFISYDLYKHIKTLCEAKFAEGAKIKELIITSSLNQKGLEEHVGFQHHFAELIAMYYELHLDEVYTAEGQELLRLGFEAILKVIANSNKEYHKFFCTKGRLEALLQEYDNACRDINLAIDLAHGHDNIIVVYEDNLNRIAIIKAYNTMQSKIAELDAKLAEAEIQKKKAFDEQTYALEKQKMDNYKIVSLMSGAIAFLLGGVKIFEVVTDMMSIVILMTMYASLFFIMLGVILLFTRASLTNKNEKKSLAGYFVASLPAVLGLAVYIVILFAL